MMRNPNDSNNSCTRRWQRRADGGRGLETPAAHCGGSGDPESRIRDYRRRRRHHGFFPKFFFDYLKLQPKSFYELANPPWKLGVRFLWGPRKQFYYAFGYETQHRYPDLARNNGFYSSETNDSTPIPGPLSAYMYHGKAFPKLPDGRPHLHNNHAYHIENHRLVVWLESTARALGVEIIDATVTPRAGHQGIAALVDASGQRWTADLYIDASGFAQRVVGAHLQRTLHQLWRHPVL